MASAARSDRLPTMSEWWYVPAVSRSSRRSSGCDGVAHRADDRGGDGGRTGGEEDRGDQSRRGQGDEEGHDRAVRGELQAEGGRDEEEADQKQRVVAMAEGV